MFVGRQEELEQIKEIKEMPVKGSDLSVFQVFLLKKDYMIWFLPKLYIRLGIRELRDEN